MEVLTTPLKGGISQNHKDRLDRALDEIGATNRKYKSCPNPNWVDVEFMLPGIPAGYHVRGTRFFDLRKIYTASLAKHGFHMSVDNQGKSPFDLSVRDNQAGSDQEITHDHDSNEQRRASFKVPSMPLLFASEELLAMVKRFVDLSEREPASDEEAKLIEEAKELIDRVRDPAKIRKV